MGTRSCIAKPLGDVGFEGRYCHWDGYVTNRGPQLWRGYHEVFEGDVDRMIAELIDAHPNGWSAFDVDGTGTCYCHDPEFSTRGDRDPNEQQWIRWIKNSPENSKSEGVWIEFVYVLHKMGFDIFMPYDTGRTYTEVGYEGRTYEANEYDFTYATTVIWAGDEPDWEAVETLCYAKAEKASEEAHDKLQDEADTASLGHIEKFINSIGGEEPRSLSA